MTLNKKLTTTLLIASTITLIGCGGGGGNGGSGGDMSQSVVDAINAPKSNLTQELKNTISYMGNEERLAYDVYNYLGNKWGTKQFKNIAANGEYKHITAVQDLVKKYDLNDNDFTNVDLDSNGYKNTPIESMQAGKYDISKIQSLYDDLTARGSDSEVEALKVGCIIEVVDVNDLNEDISIAQNSNAPDVVTVFEFLRQGSYNHYWAFDKGLKNLGVDNGCCSVGSDYCKSESEYPSNEKGQGKGRGKH